MKNIRLMIAAISLLILGCVLHIEATPTARRKNIGVFYPGDPRLEGIRFGNWGSRPYEYYWAASITPFAGKKIIDLGVGLPSQYNWYEYVVKSLQPDFYSGIDFDGRILPELIANDVFEIKHMNMASLEYPDNAFDIALCISTFEHIPYEIFMDSIKEAHRVLKKDGILLITLDEEWDKDQPINHGNGWNTLEQSLIEKGLFKRVNRSFGLPEFLTLIKDYFTLIEEDAVIDEARGIIYSSENNYMYYNRFDKDLSILNSGTAVNSCVSYAVLRKK